jgi:hypothetical protein
MDNEFYRGYTIVTLVGDGTVAIMLPNGGYLGNGTNQNYNFESHEDAKIFLDGEIRNGNLYELNVSRATIQANNNELEFIVKSPGGNIVAKSVGDPNYPDISIFIDGHCVAFVEWNPNSEKFNLYYYGTSEDTPKTVFKNITGL